jgi:hypothetical protein
MAFEIDDSFKSIGDDLSKNKTYKQVVRDYKRLKKKAGSTFEKKKSAITKRFNKLNQAFSGNTQNLNKEKKQQESLLEKLFNIKLISDDNDESIVDKPKPLSEDKKVKSKKQKFGGNVQKYIIGKFITGVEELKPQILKLLQEEILNAAGCSQDQTYTPGQTLYIKIPSIDYLGQLKVDPTSDVGLAIYEEPNLTYPTNPFPMNKELYNRIQNINQAFSIQYSSQYQGTSTQNLFDIEYTELDNFNIPGNYYKVTLANRVTGNKIKEFLKDYFTTIEIIDFKNIFANIMNQLTGVISFKKGDGKGDLGEYYKTILFFQRIMGLCVDNTKEIDVSGTAKVSELNNIDDSFFELTEVDLNFIDQQVSNVIQGVAEFTECDNVKLPINPDALIEAINNLIFVPGTNNNNTIENAIDITNSITENPDWLPLQINLDADFIKEFPKAVVFSILSPKVLLPLAIVLSAVGKTILNTIDTFPKFIRAFVEFFAQLATKIQALFVKIIFDLVVKDIKKLIQDILVDIQSEKNKKRYAVILSLSQLLVTIANIVKDFRECKNVIDSLLNSLKLVSKGLGNQLPLPLLLASKFLSGFSATRAYLNTIEEFEKLGIQTGPMSDGSPNKFMAAVKALIDSTDKEEAENGQVQVACEGFAVTPIGITIPGFCYGKKM